MSRFVPNCSELDGTARRRIYVMPHELVRRVRDYASREGLASETEAARRLLREALDARGITSPKTKGSA